MTISSVNIDTSHRGNDRNRLRGYIWGYITVVSGSALGALSALVAFAAVFVIWARLKNRKTQ